MRRREALQVFGACAVALPLGVLGQTPHARKPYRIGVAIKLTPPGKARLTAAFGVHGWREGRDYVVLDGALEYGERIEESVRATVEKKPDLAFVVSTAYALAARRMTKTIPIVMFSSGYPVEAGLIESLARPAGNVTGNTVYAGLGIWGKLIELLREAKPGIKRVGVLWSYVPPLFPAEEITPIGPEFAQASRQLGVAVHRVDVARADEVAAALAAMSAQGADALLLTMGPAFWPMRHQVLAYAADRRWPTIVDGAFPPEDKGRRPLMVYAPSWDELRRQAVDYMVRILRDGAKPGELPIQRPAKFEFVVDLKTASEIGVKLPQALLLRADRVVE